MKKESANHIFQKAAVRLGFQGSRTTFFIKEMGRYLIVNFQKSSGNVSFYINAAITYEELLLHHGPLPPPTTAYQKKDPRFPKHVDFRIEDVPNSPAKQINIDKLTFDKDSYGFELLIDESLRNIKSFFRLHGSRAEVRRLKESRSFPAIISVSV